MRVFWVHLFGLFANARKNGVPILRKVAQFIDKINKQKLGRELPWNIQAGFECDHSIAERKCPMPFLIVDNPFVVELRCPKSQLVVSIRGNQDKTIGLQECFHEFTLVRGSLSKFKFTRTVIQAGTEFLEGPVDGEFFEMSINGAGPGQKVFSAVHTSRAEMSPQLFKVLVRILPDPLELLSRDLNCQLV